MLKSVALFLVLTIYLCLNSQVSASFMYLTPSGGNMTPGKVFPIEVRLSAQPHEQITSVSVYLTYPSDQFEIAYVSREDTFPVDLGVTYGSNMLGFTRQNINGATGDVGIATIGFRPLVQNTTTSIGFIDGTRASLANNMDTLDIELTKLRPGNYNILPGAIPSSGGVNAAGAPVGDVLPQAGLFDNTLALLGFGGGLVLFGILGLFGIQFKNKIFSKQPN